LNGDRITSDPSITYTASAAGDTLLYKADGAASFSTTAPVFATNGSADGQHTVWVEEQDTAGNISAAGSLTFTLDTHSPLVTERLTSDTGSWSTDKITSNDALSGTGDPNAVVHFTVDGSAIAGTATANVSGAWTFTPAGLADGSHTVIASETDAAGNSGTASLTFGLDTTAPVITSESSNGNSGKIALAGSSSANSAVLISDGGTSIGSVTTSSNGAWSFTTAKLSDAVHTYRASDVAGNASNLAIYGSSAGDTLSGGAGNDLIMGNGGNDTIKGGAGADLLTGGAGNDRFVYGDITDSTPVSHDTIADFTHNSDKFDFSAITGLNSLTQSVTINVINGSTPTSIAAHTIDVVISGGKAILYANASASSESISTGHEDMQINLTGVATMTASDFILHH
jgi:Ca2+-binding RTX toxin-like protein